MKSCDLPASVLDRRAIVYVRQSTMIQVEGNLESQRRQYELADRAREFGFRDIVVIDDDLGISASSTSIRPGFESLVAQICEGIVGGVFCLRLLGSPVTGAIGTIYSNSADLSVRACLMSTARTIPAIQMIGFCSGLKAP